MMGFVTCAAERQFSGGYAEAAVIGSAGKAKKLIIHVRQKRKPFKYAPTERKTWTLRKKPELAREKRENRNRKSREKSWNSAST